jgi:uncharacterized membrane protein YfcA
MLQIDIGKQVSIDKKFLASMMVPAFFGSMGGAALASKVPTQQMRVVVLIALIAIFILHSHKSKTWPRRESKIGLQNRRRGWTCHRFLRWHFWPGTGTFLMAVLVGALGICRFLSASAIAKFTNVATNLAAILVFAKHGVILWGIGAALAVSNVIGSTIGSHMAIKGGSPLVRKVFLLMTGALIAKVGYDLVN